MVTNKLPVADRVLCLHTEQERRGEVLVGEDARCEVAIFYFLKVLSLVVTVGEGNDPPITLFVSHVLSVYNPSYQNTAKMSQESMKLVMKARRVYLHFQSRIVTKTSLSNRVFFLLTLNNWVLDWPVFDTIRFRVFFL